MDAVGPPQHTYRQAWFDSYWQVWVGLVTLMWACALLSTNRGRLNKAAALPAQPRSATNISPARKGWVRAPYVLSGNTSHFKAMFTRLSTIAPQNAAPKVYT
jgi:hypothetical protein